MSQFRLFTLGAFQLRLNNTLLQDFRSNKARALLAYLALDGNRAYRRDSLATLLWGEFPDKAARTNLRIELSSLRKLLLVPGDDSSDGQLFTVTREHVHLDTSHPGYWVDALAFRSLIRACEQHTHDAVERCGYCVERLRTAVGYYKGELLPDLAALGSPGWDSWREQQAQRTQDEMRWALHALVEHGQLTGAQAAARQYGEQLATLDATSGLEPVSPQRPTLSRDIEEVEVATSAGAPLDTPYHRKGEVPQPLLDASLSDVLTSPFVGREAEMQELLDRWVDPAYPLVTVTGEPGIGKTRLVLEATTRFAGQRVVALSFEEMPVRESDTLCDWKSLSSAILAALRLDLAASSDPTETLLAALSEQPLYLLLDGIDALFSMDVRSYLLVLLRSVPGLNLLVTSRARLNVACEWVIRLGGLGDSVSPGFKASNSEAAQLFVEFARRAQPGFAPDQAEMQAVEQLVALLDGHPLAIELAASWTVECSCQHIARRVDADLLAFATPAPTRQVAAPDLLHRFEQAWEGLTGRQRRLLEQLVQLPPSFDWRDVTDATDVTLLEITTLADLSLLRQRAETWELGLHPLWKAWLCLPQAGLSLTTENQDKRGF